MRSNQSNPDPGGAYGPIPISRLAAPSPLMPSSQGFIGTGGPSFLPQPVFAVPAPPLGHTLMAPLGIGPQWAPGQGGDTPGGGGGFTGEPQPVSTVWIQDGFVVAQAIQHRPGTVGFVGTRRSGA